MHCERGQWGTVKGGNGGTVRLQQNPICINTKQHRPCLIYCSIYDNRSTVSGGEGGGGGRQWGM